MMIKFCKNCQKETHRNTDGKCKLCVKQRSADYYLRNAQKRKEQVANYKAENLEPENLRAASYRQNNCNIKVRSNNTSGIKGVYWSSTFQSWHVRVFRDGRAVVSKYFKSLSDAKECRRLSAIKEYGEFSCEA